jgi:hypothetical protein
VGKEDQAEIASIITKHIKETLINLAALDPEKIRSRDRKLKEYTDIMAPLYEERKVRVRDRRGEEGQSLTSRM